MENKSKILAILMVFAIVAISVDAVADPKEDLANANAAYVRRDFDTALRLSRPLAEQGNAQAQFILAIMYETGNGVPKDDNEYLRWMRRAADQGNETAILLLSARYSDGKYGVPKEYPAKIKWLHEAAIQGDVAAQHALDREVRSKAAADRLFTQIHGTPPYVTPPKPYKWAVGMHRSQVLESISGAPQRVNKMTTQQGTTEQWIYVNRRAILYFNETGILVAIHERE